MTKNMSTQTVSTDSLNVSALKGKPTLRAFAAAFAANVPVIFTSMPGQSKSASLEAMLRQWGNHTKVVTGSNRDATDYLGLPAERDGFTTYLDIKWAADLNEHDQSALILDEFANCSEDVMRAMHRVLQERFVGELKLRDSVRIVGAMNPVEASTGGLELPSAVANRVAHLAWDFDFDLWSEGFMYGFDNLEYPALSDLAPGGTEADKARAKALVLAYLKANPQHRNAYPADDPEKCSGAWASIRSWTNLAQALAYLHPQDDSAVMALVRGLVGEDMALPFFTFLREADLIDPMLAISNPSLIDWTGRPDRLYALGCAINAVVKQDGTVPLWTKAVQAIHTGVEAGRLDAVWIIAQRLLNDRPAGSSIPTDIAVAFADRMEATGAIKAA